MSYRGEVERYVKNPSLLVELCRGVIEELDAGADNCEIAAMEVQLHEIARAIDKLDKQGVPVPDALRAEKTRLVAALGVSAEATRILSYLLNELEELTRDLKLRIDRSLEATPAKKPRTNRSKSFKTNKTILHTHIVEALRDLGTE